MIIREGKASAIRVNTRDGALGIIDSTSAGWILIPMGMTLPFFQSSLISYSKRQGHTRIMVNTKEKVQQYGIGPGDEEFLVGSCVNPEGKKQK